MGAGNYTIERSLQKDLWELSNVDDGWCEGVWRWFPCEVESVHVVLLLLVKTLNQALSTRTSTEALVSALPKSRSSDRFHWHHRLKTVKPRGCSCLRRSVIVYMRAMVVGSGVAGDSSQVQPRHGNFTICTI